MKIITISPIVSGSTPNTAWKVENVKNYYSRIEIEYFTKIFSQC